MSILSSLAENNKTPTSTTKRKSIPTDFSALGPLSTFGTVGFSGYRDSNSKKNGKRKGGDDEVDSDADEDDDGAKQDAGDDVAIKEEDKTRLSPEEATKQEKLAEGFRQIKVFI